MGTLDTMQDDDNDAESAEVAEYLAWLDQIAVGVDL